MKVAILGTGNMGGALVRGLLAKYGGDVAVTAWDGREDALAAMPAEVVRRPPREWFRGDNAVDTVVVAVKPQDIADALEPIAKHAAGTVLWCSIAAGVTLETLQRLLGRDSRRCRVMPNTPALVGEGISAYALSETCSEDDGDAAEYVLSACGDVVRVPEKLMNAVTGLSGSGPAYVYLFIEALIEGGVCAGLPYETARRLAVRTVKGAAAMVERTGSTPADLKAKVMSPGGTTARGMMALEEHGLKHAIMRAVAEATRRAQELGS